MSIQPGLQIGVQYGQSTAVSVQGPHHVVGKDFAATAPGARLLVDKVLELVHEPHCLALTGSCPGGTV